MIDHLILIILQEYKVSSIGLHLASKMDITTLYFKSTQTGEILMRGAQRQVQNLQLTIDPFSFFSSKISGRNARSSKRWCFLLFASSTIFSFLDVTNPSVRGDPISASTDRDTIEWSKGGELTEMEISKVDSLYQGQYHTARRSLSRANILGTLVDIFIPAAALYFLIFAWLVFAFRDHPIHREPAPSLIRAAQLVKFSYISHFKTRATNTTVGSYSFPRCLCGHRREIPPQVSRI